MRHSTLPILGLLCLLGGTAVSCASFVDSSGENALLVNATDVPLYYDLLAPGSERPTYQEIDLELTKPPRGFVPADSSSVLLPCDALGKYDGYEILLYRVVVGSEGKGEAYLSKTLTWDQVLSELKKNCRIEITTLPTQ